MGQVALQESARHEDELAASKPELLSIEVTCLAMMRLADATEGEGPPAVQG